MKIEVNGLKVTITDEKDGSFLTSQSVESLLLFKITQQLKELSGELIRVQGRLIDVKNAVQDGYT